MATYFTLGLTSEDGSSNRWARLAARVALRDLERQPLTPRRTAAMDYLGTLSKDVVAARCSDLRQRFPEKKILLFVSSLRVSGGPRILLTFYRLLAQAYPDFEFVIVHGEHHGQRSRVSMEEAVVRGARIVQLPVLRGEFDQKRADHVGDFIDMLVIERPMIIHLFEWRSEAAKIAADIANVPIVIHSTLGESLLGGRLAFESLLSRLTTVFTHESHIELEKWLTRYRVGCRSQHRVVPSNFELAPFLSATQEQDGYRWRQARGIARDAFVIGASGVFSADRQKGFDLMVLAFARFLELSSEGLSRLILLGEGEEKERIVALSKSLGVIDSVLFLDFQPYDEMPSFFKALDVFALPSRYEGVPGTLMQAMTAGTPSVCTDCGGVLSVVAHEREALVVPLSDERGAREETAIAEDLAAHLYRYKRSPELARRIGRNARRRALRQFDLGATRRALADLYGDCNVASSA